LNQSNNPEIFQAGAQKTKVYILFPDFINHHLHPPAARICVLVAVIDWYFRQVLSWRLSNTLNSGFCVDYLAQALRAYGTPEIFNTNQGCHSHLTKLANNASKVTGYQE
jgi:transposase InsO family protein